MRLTSVKVEGLFGLFDHEVQLNQEERITIATGPNGVGKTTLLRLISSFFGSDFQEIVRVSFGQALFAFDNGLTVSVEREVSDGEEGGPEEETLPKLIFRNGENEWKYEVTTRRVSPAWIERDMPWMERIEGGFWRDRTDGEVIPHRTMIRRYGRGPRRRAPRPPDWLREITTSISCRFIQTQRLLDLSGDESEAEAVVEQDAKDLAREIESTLAEYAGVSQGLDQSFPGRVVRHAGEPADESDLRTRIKALDEERDRLTRTGLLSKSQVLSLDFSRGEWDESIRRVLQVYVEDTQKKLKIFGPLYEKISAFSDILNDKFLFKTVETGRDTGIVVRASSGATLPLASLSSGEQHELVLLYELLFKTKPGTLLLIDEPELSLHIAWQKRFISDLERVMKLVEVDAVLATHSPQIINDRWDLTVELGSHKE